LIDCVLVRKNSNFPYLPSQNGEPIFFVKFCRTTQLRNVMIYTRRLLNIFSRFLFTEGQILRSPYTTRMASNRA